MKLTVTKEYESEEDLLEDIKLRELGFAWGNLQNELRSIVKYGEEHFLVEAGTNKIIEGVSVDWVSYEDKFYHLPTIEKVRDLMLQLEV